MNKEDISPAALRRLPFYLRYLRGEAAGRKTISASAVAAHFGLNDVQVRKDLAAVSGTGRPRVGYDTAGLIAQLEDCLGCKHTIQAVLVGVGHLGNALLMYDGFADYGLAISAAFDSDPALAGTTVGGKPVYSMDRLAPYCRENAVALGVLTVPASAAQEVCNILAGCGVAAVWNFAPVMLHAPGVRVENENLASSLAVLSRHIRRVG